MQIKHWSQNPSHKLWLDQILETAHPVDAVENWQLYDTISLKNQSALLIAWRPERYKGALVGSTVQYLSAALKKRLNQNPDYQSLYLVIGSAGADVRQPFDSLAAINELIMLIADWSLTLKRPVIGCLVEPPGSYGGASLWLSTLCSELWCEDEQSFHLVGV